MKPDGTSAPSESTLDALRAAVARIEQGESTGFLEELEETPIDAPTQPGSAPQEWAPTRETKEAILREVMARIQAAHPAGVPKPAGSGKGPVEGPSRPGDDDGPSRKCDEEPDHGPAEEPQIEADTETERDADPYAVARAIVLRQLTMSPKSRQQLREKLRQRNCPDDVAEAVLDRMTHVGLVDDEKYAETFVRSRQVSRGLSTRALAHDLRTKGVDRDTVEAVLAEVTPMDEEERARGLVDARLPRLRDLERHVVIRRLAGMLARKGYPSGLSLKVIREAIDADPAFRRD